MAGQVITAHIFFKAKKVRNKLLAGVQVGLEVGKFSQEIAHRANRQIQDFTALIPKFNQLVAHGCFRLVLNNVGI